MVGFSGLANWSLGAGLLLVLFLTHILVGAVELGTDGWIQNITGNILSSEQGKILFAFTSLTMFLLRFCADFIERTLKLTPVAILLICAISGFRRVEHGQWHHLVCRAMLALTIYGVGKTFFWPTMLAVASDRFPRTGAVAISIMGGLGMMSAGLLGSVGLGYAKDRFAGAALEKADAAVYQEYKSEKSSQFLVFSKVNGLDGSKLGEINKKLEGIRADIAKEKGDISTAPTKLEPDEQKAYQASIQGDRETLRADSFIPLTMAIIYLLMLLYFKSIGGYKRVTIGDESPAGH